jgi:hypothetical protein
MIDRAGLLMGALRGVAAPAGALLLIAGVVLSWSGGESALERRSAIELRGVVIAKELVRADRETNPSTRFVARYRLALPGGETIEAEEDLPRKAWEARALGGEHPVLYLPEKRTTLPPAGSARHEGEIIMAVMGAVLLVVGLLVARRPTRRLLERMQLLGRGVSATATVTALRETSTARKGKPYWRLHYRYRAGGVEREGESDLLTLEEAREWRIGATGPILYDPSQPASSAWLGRHAAAPDQSAGARTWAWLRDAARWVARIALVLVAIFVAGVIGELVPGLKELEAWMTEERTPLLYVTGAATTVGLFVMLGAIISLIMERGEPLDHTGVENVSRSVRDTQMGPRFWRTSAYRIFGKTAGATADDEFTFAELKGAFRSGALFSEGRWRRRLLVLCGGGLMFLGMFGVMIVLSPLALKLLLAAAVLYAVVRATWGLIRA